MRIIGTDGICGTCGDEAEDGLYVLENPEKDAWLPICSRECVDEHLDEYPHLDHSEIRKEPTEAGGSDD